MRNQIMKAVSEKKICLVCGFILSRLMFATFVSILSTPVVRAQSAVGELQTVKVEGQSQAATAPEASREISVWATSATAREQVIELIGDARYQKNKATVEAKIVKQALKFIPFVNPGVPSQLPDGTWKMSVELRVSPQSLRKMVLEAGLLNEAEGPASIVPLVAFTDRSKGLSTRWWMGEEKDDAHKVLVQGARSFYDRMQKEFMRQGFHMVKPAGAQQSPLPEALRVERPTQSDLASIGQYFKAPMALKGDVRFRESQEIQGAVNVSVRLQVVQASSGRAIADLSRQFVSDVGNFDVVARNKMAAELPEIAKDLASQVMDAWQRGTINANLIRLAVRGELGPKEIVSFKQNLVRSIRDVKDLKERNFERGQIVFEVDYTGDAKKLASSLQAAQMTGFHTRVAESSDASVTLEVKAH